ncbi:receptor protein kinase TMK1-like [Cannabis sativa]|uniref:receptor protein kinase TMK1-like n=1 Tax=Cannabis sativa TaxID=3483 RepID=UPI0029CA6854|nr:receptor protein kinase TMK1-like [Cannabis sativa]
MELSQLTHQTPLTLFFFLCFIFTTTTIADDESAAMADLLASISPTPLSWSNSVNYCDNWKGIECSSSGKVTTINLANHSLMGTLPSNLNSLKKLTFLNLQGNSLNGSLPLLSNLSLLKQIYLDSNNFTSVPSGCFQGLKSLLTLSMSQNSNLNPWQFPTELVDSSNLVTLSISSCNMFGSIPDVFDSFPNLEILKLSKNRLTGSLPQSFAVTNIRILWLNGQQRGLSGTIDVLSKMTKLYQVWLQENQMTGPIPNLSKLDTLFDLQLRDNVFTGAVPNTLMSISSLRNVTLSNNMLQGPLPSFPSTLTNVDLTGTNSFCKDTWGPCDDQVMTLLEVAKDLGYPLELANSWKGNDACDNWKYVDCDYSVGNNNNNNNNSNNVVSVDFQRWQLSGLISPAFGNLTTLRSLFLNDNNLTGSIPFSLTLLTQLEILDVSNNNLSGVIPIFPPKVKLITFGNPLLKKSRNLRKVKERKIVLKAALATTASVIGVLMIFLVLCWRKLSCLRKEKNPAQRSIEDFLRSCGPLQVRRYSYSEVKKMTNSFKEKLGQGGFGSVYKGKILQDGSLVAVKLLHELKTNGEEFINEVATISRTSHVNIVSLLGFCFEGTKKALIYEFMANGSLERFVFEDNNKLDWDTNYQISLGIARGLEYLHRGCNTRILHFDIKPHNILLDADFVPKISDFGLAKICNKKESLISVLGLRGTIGYIAPEVFSRVFGGVSYKSDVYSYGMMVLEIVGGRKNVNVRVENSSEIYFPHWVYNRLELDEEFSLKRISNEEDRVKVRKMIIVSLWCIQTDPSCRPTMSKVIEMLEGSVDFLELPPKPFLSSPSKFTPADQSSSSTSPLSHSYTSFL